MNPRGAIIAALLVAEVAIIGVASVAIQGGRPGPSFTQPMDFAIAPGSRLIEGGPHQIFRAGPHPALTVNIGNADLTILTSKASQIEASVSPSTAYGRFRATAPIAAREDGETLHIATTQGRRWSIGDNRMVTVVVPPGTRVTVVNAGDIRASGLRAEASLTSIGAGSVTIEDYDAPALHVASSNGSITLLRVVAARIDATSSDGHVDGTALQVRDGSIEGSGPVTLGLAPGGDTLVTAATNNGSVNVSGFPAAAVTGDRKTSDDGDDDASSRTVRVGAGNGRLDVHSSDGDVNLAQEG